MSDQRAQAMIRGWFGGPRVFLAVLGGAVALAGVVSLVVSCAGPDRSPVEWQTATPVAPTEGGG